MWVKYKHNFAYGSNKKWTYIEIEEESYIKECGYEGDDAIGEYLIHEWRVGDDYAYSDKYMTNTGVLIGKRLKVCHHMKKSYGD